MSDLVTQNEVTQAMSKMLLDVTAGRIVKKDRLEKAIAASDATVRRMQMQVNAVKTMIECKKHGIDFANAMREVRGLDGEANQDFLLLMDKQTDD